MAPVSVGVGMLLVALGMGFYFGTGQEHPTALIAAAFGVAFVILGLLGLRERLRKHVMHAAAALGLAGFIIPLVRLVPKISAGNFNDPAAIELTAMALICLVFVILCVRSFIVVRRRRRLAESE